MAIKMKAYLIGNSEYPNAILRNAKNDAQDLGSKLKILGFDVTMLINTKISELDGSIKTFGKELNSFEVGLFFFAGHGLQIEGMNFLTAVDTNFEAENEAKWSSVALDKIIDAMEKSTCKSKIIILDACRDNPYERGWSRSIATRGLAPVHAPKGTIIAFATSPGQRASDGTGRNGVYTEALLKHIADQDIPIETMFKRVRNTVALLSNNKQTTWEHTSLLGEFSFNISLPTDLGVSVYDKSAIEDESFILNSSNPAHKIVQGFKSINWYTQEATFKALDAKSISSADKNTLFVLGRNLYQTAHGGERVIRRAFENLELILDKFPAPQALHILNGILFEIYFGKDGKFRIKTKSDLLKDVFSLEDNSKYAKSFEFIRHELIPHFQNLFYIPKSTKNVVLNIRVKPDEEGRYIVKKIQYDGDDILIKDEKSVYFAFGQEETYQQYPYTKFVVLLSDVLLVPIHKLAIKANKEIGSSDILLFPNGYIFKKDTI